MIILVVRGRKLSGTLSDEEILARLRLANSPAGVMDGLLGIVLL